MDSEAVRTFVVAAELGQFQQASAALSISQQAVSKRIATLERLLGARLFLRTPRGLELTVDGRAFLPHAREVVRVTETAAISVRAGRRPFRIDVPVRPSLPGRIVGDFRRDHPDLSVDVITLPDVTAAIAAIEAGTLDLSLRAVPMPARRLPRGVVATRVLDEQLAVLLGPRHRLAGASAVTPAQLAGHPIWMPDQTLAGERALFFEEFAAMFGLRIERLDPAGGIEPLLDTLAESTTVLTLIGDATDLLWPVGHDLRRLRLVRPVPIYPHSLITRRDQRHPALSALQQVIAPDRRVGRSGQLWEPSWA